MKGHHSTTVFSVFLALAFLVSNGATSGIFKRSQARYEIVTSGGVEEFKQKFLQLFNQQRSSNGLPSIALDPTLTSGAQEWAERDARTGELAHSCTRCEQFSEILAKRRSPHALPEGVEAAEWAFQSWFDEDDYDDISKNPEIQKVGVGIAYIRKRDKSYHAYAVARFSK